MAVNRVTDSDHPAHHLPPTGDMAEILGRALDVLQPMIPYELATIMILRGPSLEVCIARGRLASPEIFVHRVRLGDFPSIADVLKGGFAKAVLADELISGDGGLFDGVLDLPSGHSCMVVPLNLGTEPIGLMTFDKDFCSPYGGQSMRLAEVFGQLLAIGLAFGEQNNELSLLCARLEDSNRMLAKGLDISSPACDRIESCISQEMRRVSQLARQVAGRKVPVLLTGETGTGKGVLARAIHEWHGQSDRPFVVVNCAALPRDLLESELFGHVAGAFTGARSRRTGRFEAADGGTIFLDEIGEIPYDLQAKLLTILQDGTFEPVGSSLTQQVNVRILAATNLDLDKAILERRFREDLYYRLAVFPIHLPRLQDRRDDIPYIAESFLHSLSRQTGRGPWFLTAGQLSALSSYHWPGNVRELINALERATILSNGHYLDLGDRVTNSRGAPVDVGQINQQSFRSLEQVERDHINLALRKCAGKVHGKGGAAELLEINPSTLRSRMRKHGLLSSKSD